MKKILHIFPHDDVCKELARLLTTNEHTCKRHTTEMASLLEMYTEEMSYEDILSKIPLIIHYYHGKKRQWLNVKMQRGLYGFFRGQSRSPALENVKVVSFEPPPPVVVVS